MNTKAYLREVRAAYTRWTMCILCRSSAIARSFPKRPSSRATRGAPKGMKRTIFAVLSLCKSRLKYRLRLHTVIRELLKIPTAGFSTLSTSGTICISKVRKSMYGREIFPLELRNCSIARKSRWVIRIKRSTGTTNAAKSITIMKISKSSSKPITATRSRFKGQRKLK